MAAEFQFSVESDLEEARKYLNAVERRAVPKAATRALNRTMTNVRTVSRRSVAKGMGQRQKDIKDQFNLIRASRNRFIASLRASGRPIPLIRFRSPKQLKRGVKVTFAGRRRLMEGAFIARMPSGHRGIFRRTSRARLPIKQLYGPSVPAWFVTREVTQAMESTAEEKWRPNFERDLAYYLSRVR